MRAVSRLREPWAATGPMDEAGGVVHGIECIPGFGQLADLIVRNVLEAVQAAPLAVSTTSLVHSVRRSQFRSIMLDQFLRG